MSRIEHLNEIQIPYDKHHKVSSLVKSHQNTHNAVKYEKNMKMSNNPAKYEVLIKQYLDSILDINVKLEQGISEYHGEVTYYQLLLI